MGAGWIADSESGFLDFAAAAVRANRAGGDAVRIFVAIVRKKLWHHITHADEERARAVINRERGAVAPSNSPLSEILFRAAA